MQIPDKWLDYPCQDYFDSALPIEGVWDAEFNTWFITPLADVWEDDEDFLQVGWLGVDGIVFGYRRNRPGFWAFYRTLGPLAFKYLAPTVQEFLSGWDAGTIHVDYV